MKRKKTQKDVSVATNGRRGKTSSRLFPAEIIGRTGYLLYPGEARQRS